MKLSEAIVISDKGLTFDNDGRACVEASDLGLAPGVWPEAISVEASGMPGHTTRFLFNYWLEAEAGATYRTHDGLAAIDLYND